MPLRGGIAVDFCCVVEKPDADLDRAHVTLANTGLKVEEQLLRARVVELAKLFDFRRRLPGDGALEGLMAGLLRDSVIRRKGKPHGYRRHRLALSAADTRNLFGDGFERKPHSLEMQHLGFEPARSQSCR